MRKRNDTRVEVGNWEKLSQDKAAKMEKRGSTKITLPPPRPFGLFEASLALYQIKYFYANSIIKQSNI